MLALCVRGGYETTTEVEKLQQEQFSNLPFVTLGEANDIEVFGFSIRNIVFYFIRSGVKGYIAGYEGRFNIPKECLDDEFQVHVSQKAWDAVSVLATFWRQDNEIILNRVILLLVTLTDEIMNDCGDGKILIDLFQLYNSSGSILNMSLRLLFNALYTSPLLIVWGAISLAFNVIFCFWVGSYGIGQFLRTLVLGNPYIWD